MPDRVIRERARKSEKLAALSAESERLWWRLVTMVDDYGRIRDNPVLILAEAFPLMADRITVDQIEGWLSDLTGAHLVKRYRADGVSVLWLIGWSHHQEIESPVPSELPGPERINPGRIVAAPRITHAHVPARARTVSPLSNRISNSNTVTPVSGDTGIQLPLQIEREGSTEGGAGGNRKTSHRYDNVEPPEALRSLDEILRRGLGARYRPSERFYARIRDFADIPGIDLDYQAEGMVSWLTTNTKGKKYTDIPRFVDSWLERRADDLSKRQRPRGGIPYNGNGTGRSGRPFGMGGPISDEARESARRAEQRSRELGD